jgi:hypothetical protein
MAPLLPLTCPYHILLCLANWPELPPATSGFLLLARPRRERHCGNALNGVEHDIVYLRTPSLVKDSHDPSQHEPT